MNHQVELTLAEAATYVGISEQEMYGWVMDNAFSGEGFTAKNLDAFKQTLVGENQND